MMLPWLFKTYDHESKFIDISQFKSSNTSWNSQEWLPPDWRNFLWKIKTETKREARRDMSRGFVKQSWTMEQYLICRTAWLQSIFLHRRVIITQFEDRAKPTCNQGQINEKQSRNSWKQIPNSRLLSFLPL